MSRRATGIAMRLAGSLAAALLLAALFVQQVTASRWTSAVVDEPAHLTAGYLSLVEGDLTVNREHPPLVKALAALPLLWMNPRLPPEESGGPRRGSEDFEFHYARAFLYQANDADRLLQAARIPVILLTVILGAVLYVWVREIAGMLPALAALALAAFEPTLLGHGRLVTTDMGAALFALAALWTLRLTLRGGSPVGAAACGLALGLAMLTKFSTLLLLPLMLLLAVADRLLAARGPDKGHKFFVNNLKRHKKSIYNNNSAPERAPAFPPPAGRRPGPERLAILAAIIVCTAWLILLAGYGFDGFPLPRLYLEGLEMARAKNATIEGPTYLMGRISEEGFRSYFLVALAVKLPVPLLLLSVAGGAAGLALRERRREFLWLLLPPAAWIAAMSLLTRAQIGVRYVLPAVPFLCAAAGAGLPALARLCRDALRGPAARWAPRALAVSASLLIAWQAASVLAWHPHHLSWFNSIAGGPLQGWRWLTDSNVDWGQDLVGLKRWQVDSGNPPVNLYYFGTADPDYYGIRRHPYGQAAPGWFAASATHLAGVYLPDPDYLKPLRERSPDATIGGSIFLYHLDTVPPGLRRPLVRAPRGRDGGRAP